MKKLLLRAAVPVLFAASAALPAAAQVQPTLPSAPATPPAADDSLQVNLKLLPDSLVAAPTPLDSVKLAWLRTPPELRDLVGDRISCFETDVPHVFNSHVMAFVRLFTERQRGYTQRVLERENLYFPLFEKYLAKYNLPTDLKYLAVVESALIPTAKSRVGATGLWQFMGPTANDLRLRRDEWVDERMNPEKATEAACKHLRYLYGVFHDWEMVLAAYNWGAGNMQKVVRRTGKKTYWEVHPHLPAETRNYVPTFTAIMYTLKYAHQHQLHSPALRYQYPEPMDTLQLAGRAFDLTRLARACGYSDSMALARLNPELRKLWLPQGYRPYAVQLPAAVRPALAVVDRATLFDYCRPLAELPQLLPFRVVALTGVEPFPTRTVADGGLREKAREAQPRFRRVRHTVKRGETVASVAERYAVSPAQLRRWNTLGRANALTPRRQLVVFVPVPATSTASSEVRMAATENRKNDVAVARPAVKIRPVAETSEPEGPALARPASRLASPARTARIVPETVAAAQPDDSGPATYVVRRGDFLEKVARTHGLTVSQLMARNKLTAATLTPGQKLNLRETEDTAAEIATATREAAAAAQEPARRAARPALPAPQVHLVQPGDTLYNISRRYQGLTVEKLRELNNLQSDEVKPGQKLIVKS
ncbi:membrane-bound lytic murein transglycosylase D [Hymenobacter luteus]|uniref:Membrane-bound lytic murein transglycosylase D n=2 Tax=Hymenobacter TaxID=89966 RepID=A0A7W9SXQ0_9BACT|nr:MULTISPECIES: LysM peptidoglycan-binding domain-containing protein [Hymenobacter]MBB4599849.1 membrane-bound lytic murein transglycosylase D [Hymenobacter latericoloratus]MBB6057841.1 membrane-bound lytic murein transglycosylase D [Hymenobacter luteus]